jgi:transcription factor C subunit 7
VRKGQFTDTEIDREWYGKARFDHPSPADAPLLRTFFPHHSLDYKPTIIPSKNGETIDELHNRTAYALASVIALHDSQANGPKAILICTHAATIIAIGRALTGRMPEDIQEEDFLPYTCGLSKFTRKNSEPANHPPSWGGEGKDIPEVEWRGKGVAGGWECVLNGDCSFLSGGAERGW